MKYILLLTGFLALPVQAAIVSGSAGGSVTAGTNITVSGTAVSLADSVSLSSITPTHILGTATNDSATAGTYGEYVSSTTVNRPVGTTGQYADMVAIVLTAGDWDVTACGVFTNNGATVTEYDLGVTTTAGNVSTGLVNGVNNLNAFGLSSASVNAATCMPNVRLSLSGAATAYLKVFATFSVATPQIVARISARRVR